MGMEMEMEMGMGMEMEMVPVGSVEDMDTPSILDGLVMVDSVGDVQRHWVGGLPADGVAVAAIGMGMGMEMEMGMACSLMR